MLFLHLTTVMFRS